jgi:hypothetical protein
MTEPFESRLPAVFFPDGIVPYGAAVFDLEALLGRLGQVGRNHRIVRISKRIGMYEAKVSHVEKALNLAACKAKDIQAWTGNLLEAGIVPMRHGWNVWPGSVGDLAADMSRSDHKPPERDTYADVVSAEWPHVAGRGSCCSAHRYRNEVRDRRR